MAERLRPDGALGRLFAAQLAMLVVLGVVFGVALELVIAHEELSIDRAIADVVVAQRRPWLDRVLAIGTWAGSAAVLVPVVAVAGLRVRHVTRSWGPLLFLASSVGGASVLSNTIKLAVSRPRPHTGAVVEALGYAFPSGHATAATAGWVSVAVALGTLTPSRRRKVVLLTMAVVLAAFVGLSRVYLGVHMATDVLGGWALGGLWLTVLLVGARLRARRRDDPETRAHPLLLR